MKHTKHQKKSKAPTSPERSGVRRFLPRLEVVIVITIVALITVTVTAYAFDGLERKRVQKTRLQITWIAKKVDAFAESSDEGTLPRDIFELTRSEGDARLASEDIEDAWGSELVYTRLKAGEFEITSAGPDREDGTDDDIRIQF